MRAGSELALVAVVAGATSPVFAEDIDSETFRSTPSVAADTFQVEPAEVGENGEWLASTAVSYTRNPVAIETSLDGNQLSNDRPVTNRTMIELGGAFAFLGRFEAGVRVPLFAQGGEAPDASSFHVPAADGFALGDISVHGRARLLRSQLYSIGASLHLTLPTSTSGQFVGVDGPSARVLALASLRPNPRITLAVNAGAVLRRLSTYRNDGEVMGGAIAISQGSGFAWGASASMRATDQLRITTELFGEVLTTGGMTRRSTPVDALIGTRYQLANGLTVGVAVGRGITDSIGTAELRGVVVLAFAPSRATQTAESEESEPEREPLARGPDNSTAIRVGARDKCPTQAEDIDGFEDEDGCPDPDNDGDAIPDGKDKCPDEAEVINGITDNDGCPDEAKNQVAGVSGSLSPTQAAEQTFLQGRQLMKEKKYQQACVAFEHSQRLDPQFGTQFNLAGCYAEIGKLATAWTMFKELVRVDKNADRRGQAAEAVAKLAKRVPKLKLVAGSPPKGMQVFMNGVDAKPLVNIDTPLDFGSYELVAGAPGHRSWRKTIVVDAEGQIVKATIQLEAMKK